MKLKNGEIEKIMEIFFRKYKYDRESFYDVAAIGFVKAMEKFDKNRDTKFSTYAISCMHKEILFEIRKCGQKKRWLDSHAESLDSLMADSGSTLGDIVADNKIKDIDIELDIQIALKKIQKILSPKEYKILELKMLEMADKDIASVLGLPENIVTSVQKNFKYNPKIVEILYSLELI